MKNLARISVFALTVFSIFSTDFMMVFQAFAEKASPQEQPVTLEAESLEYDKNSDIYLARGNARIMGRGITLFADRMELDNKSNTAKAQGRAVLEMGEDFLQSDQMIFNIGDKTATAYQAQAFYARNHFYVKGDEIEKTGENTYTVKNPAATTCDGDQPDWQITGSGMKVTLEGYGTVSNACFRVKEIPLLYFPFIIFPAKTKRQTGFLIPYLAYSRDKDGLDIEIPFFWAISSQADATFYQRYLEKRGWKEGVEFRYSLSGESFGTLYGDYLEDDKDLEDVVETGRRRRLNYVVDLDHRWSYYFNHVTAFDPTFYVRTDFNRVSDRWYFKDFSSHNYYLDHDVQTSEDLFCNVSYKADKSVRYLESMARLHKGWGTFSVNGLIAYMDDFSVRRNDSTLQRYPEIILTAVKQPLWKSPFFYEVAGVYDYFQRDKGDKGHFIDFSPTVSLPLNLLGYAKITPQFAFKETFWNATGEGDESRGEKGTSDHRTLYRASVSISSQLSRVFDLGVNGWEKIRHEIRPEIVYAYVPETASDNVPDYYLSAMMPFTGPGVGFDYEGLKKQKAVFWSLTNSLTARVRDASNSIRYLEFFKLRLFQAYDLDEADREVGKKDPERRPFSDLGIELDIQPYKEISFKMRDYCNVYDGWTQRSYDLFLKDKRNDLFQVGYRYVRGFIEEIHLGLRAVLSGHLYGTCAVKQDLNNSRVIGNSIGLFYHRQCWSMGFEVTDTEDDLRFLFKVSLAGFNKLDVE